MKYLALTFLALSTTACGGDGGATAPPAPEVDILKFTLAGPVLAVRPHCHNDHYWQVYFDTNITISAELGRAGFAVPQPHYRIHGAPEWKAASPS